MFFYIIIVLVTIIIILVFSKFEIKIHNLKISTEKKNDRIIDKKYKVTIFVYIFGKIPLKRIEITKEKLDKINIKDKIKKFKIKNVKLGKIDKASLKKIKNAKPKLKYINLLVNIGTENAVLTSYIVVTISTILGIVLKQELKNSGNKFIVNPIYLNKNLLNLELNCIIEIKMIHIIYVIYILNKKRRDDEDVRTSNRRSYGYSYE